MPNASSRPRLSYSAVNGRSGNDSRVSETPDRIPQLMDELQNQRASDDYTSSYRDQYLTQTVRQNTISNRASCATAAGSPTRRDKPYDIGECVIHSSSPPAPWPRALELVKKEVHRALEAFSTRPLKGESSAPRPSDLLRPFDVSKDGRVTYRELQAGILGLGIGLTGREARALARAVDREDSGLVDRGQFEAAATHEWGHGGGECQGTTSVPAAESEAFGTEDSPGECENHEGALGSPEEQQQQASSRNRARAANGTRVGDDELTDNEERVEPPPPPPPSERPKLVPQASRSDLATTISRVRSLPTVSFDHWQRHRTAGRGTGSEDNGVKTPVATTLTAARNSSRMDGNNNNHCETLINKNNNNNNSDRRSSNSNSSNIVHNYKRSLSQKRANSLNTLRSLLREDGIFDYAGRANTGDRHRHSSFDSEGGGWKGRDRRPQQQQQHNRLWFHEDRSGFGSATSGGVGGERRGNSGKTAHRHPRDKNGRATGHGGRQQGKNRAGGSRAAADDIERQKAIATRAENILRLRSRGDIVGLRRAMSKADPSASGVVSKREMERVVLRRFGTGLGNDEASELASKYRSEFNGRSMVDYDRLFDSLDAKEAGLFDQTVAAESPFAAPYSGRGREREREGGQRQQQQLSRDSNERRATSGSMAAVEGSRRRGSSRAPPAAGSRTQRRYSRRGVPGFDVALSKLVKGNIPVEDSQLVRRARAKTLALLDRHGTRSVDCVFGLIDPGQTQSVSSRELREGLRMLGGSDTLSEVEHRALFRELSKGHDRIQYKELLDNLRMAEAAENRERTQRKLAHQARLPTSARGSASHWRHSDVLDWDVPPAGGGSRGDPSEVGLTGGRQHKESRRQALVFERLRESVRQIQEGRNSAGPVFDMFQQGGQAREAGKKNTAAAPSSLGGNDNKDPDNGQRSPPPLSPAALQAGLGSLGVPLGNKDFVALMATVDPDHRGEVSYPTFCKALKLHRLRGGSGGGSATQRPSSAPLQRMSSRSTGGGEGGGYARRRAMELAPPADAHTDLEGGVFHVNPATHGCANPNFTTTMIPVGSREGRSAQHLGAETYRPKRRQSGDEARTKAHKQTLLVVGGGDRVERWNEAGTEAERCFRKGFGVKMRRSQSLSSCYAGARRGWDNLGTPSPRGSAPPPTPPTTSSSSAVAWTDNNAIIFTGGSGNRRGRYCTPRNNDLGFGSERMRSQSRGDDEQDHCRRRGRTSNSGVAEAGSRRAQSLSLGAERRYGDWARSSVQHLLRQDGWLGVRSPRRTRSFNTTKEPSPGFSGEGKDQRRHRAAVETTQQTGRPRSSPGQRPSTRNSYSDRPVARNSARHPAQTRERRASPYATDADFSSAASPLPAGATRGVAGRPGDGLSRTHPRTVVGTRARNSEPDVWGNTVTGCGARAAGECSPTLRWGESMRLPQEESGERQSARRRQAGAQPYDAKAASKLSF